MKTTRFTEAGHIASTFDRDPKKIDRAGYSDRDKRQLAMLIGLSVEEFVQLHYVDEDTSEQVNAIKMELLSEAKKRTRNARLINLQRY